MTIGEGEVAHNEMQQKANRTTAAFNSNGTTCSLNILHHSPNSVSKTSWSA